MPSVKTIVQVFAARLTNNVQWSLCLKRKCLSSKKNCNLTYFCCWSDTTFNLRRCKIFVLLNKMTSLYDKHILFFKSFIKIHTDGKTGCFWREAEPNISTHTQVALMCFSRRVSVWDRQWKPRDCFPPAGPNDAWWLIQPLSASAKSWSLQSSLLFWC